MNSRLISSLELVITKKNSDLASNIFISGPSEKLFTTDAPLKDTIALFSKSKGNAQGKYQRHLEVEGNRDYLQAPLWDGSPVEITVPPANDGKNLFKVSSIQPSVSYSWRFIRYICIYLYILPPNALLPLALDCTH